jgi:hypothetical protein
VITRTEQILKFAARQVLDPKGDVVDFFLACHGGVDRRIV